MDSLDEIRKRLERFYAGETSLEEEKALENYFSRATVPEELIPDKELFHSLSKGKAAVPVPGDLNSKILDTIDRVARKETRTRRISLYSLSGLAAGLLVIIAVYVYIRVDRPSLLASQQMTDTYNDPMDAYQEAKKALAFVSNKFNEGTSELGYVKEISKTAEPLKSLSKINKGSRELSLLGQLHRVEQIER